MKKILLIEDDSYIRKMVANRLETEGYKVLSAFAKHSEEFPYLIVLTGYYNKEDMKVIEEMAHEVIHKPTDEDAIVKAVKNWLPLRPS